VHRVNVVILATVLGGLLAAAPGAAAAAGAGPAGPGRPHPAAHQRWTAPRRWAAANDWEPNVAASPRSPWVYQMTTRYSHPSACGRGMRHCIVFRASADHGRTWTAARPMPRRYCPPGRRCALASWQNDPVLAVSTSGVIYAAWMNGWNVTFMRSTDHGRSWHDAAYFRRAAGLSFTDKPWLAISPSGRDVYVAFNSSNSYIAASHDYGRTWSAPVRTNSDHRYWFAEAGAVAPDGTVYFGESAEHQNDKGDIRLAVLSSADAGRTWRTRFVGTSQQQPPCRVADCPHDFFGSQISLAVGRSGTVLAAYCANAKAGAPLGLYAISSADGKRWSAPRLLSGQGTAVGAGFPKVAAGLRPRTFEVAWADDRDGPAAWNIWATRTTDAGATWSRADLVSRPTAGHPGHGFAFPYGDYFGITVDRTGTVYLAWSEGKNYDGPGSTWWSKSRP